MKYEISRKTRCECAGRVRIIAFLLVCMLVAIAGCVSAPKPPPVAAARPAIDENYPCYRVEKPIALDGKMGDPAWAKAPAVKFYLIPHTREPEFKTEARLLYNHDHLYIGYKAVDPDVWAYFTNRDDATCIDDCLELFFQTDPAREPYYGFEINALGTINDSYYLRAVMAGGGHRRWNKWTCTNLVVKTACDGTLNDPYDTDRGWSLEMAIPFAELPSLAGKKPQPGDTWKFHAARCEYSVCRTNSEASTCAPLTNKSFHVNQDWLNLNFK